MKVTRCEKDVRDKVDLQVVSAEIDGRSQFTFSL